MNWLEQNSGNDDDQYKITIDDKPIEPQIQPEQEKALYQKARNAFKYFVQEIPYIKFTGTETKREPGLFQGDTKKIVNDFKNYFQQYQQYVANDFTRNYLPIKDLLTYYKRLGKDPIMTFDFSGKTAAEVDPSEIDFSALPQPKKIKGRKPKK